MDKSIHQVSTSVLQFPSVLKDASSLVFSFYLCAATALLFVLLSSEQFFHWFIIPITVCGVIIGIDAIDWARGRLQVFDPVGLIGLFGLYFFFIGPILHVVFDYQLAFLAPIDDWRPWLGGMAVLNSLGLLVYRLTRGWIKPYVAPKQQREWKPVSQLLVIALLWGLIATGGLQVLSFQNFGGLEGFANASYSDLRGWGVVFTLSESFPVLLMMGFAVYAHNRAQAQSGPVIVIFLVLFFIMRFLFFGGLRGSRSNTLYMVIWALGIIHFYVRPVSRKHIYIGVIFALLFVYTAGIFKSLRWDFFTQLQEYGIQIIPDLAEETGRDFESTLMEDLGRASLQAYMLFRFQHYSDTGFKYYASGQTYIAGLLNPIPASLFPGGKPVGKLLPGTQLLKDNFIPGRISSSRVYALAGEAMLNFGVVAVPFAFAFWGIAVGLVRRWMFSWTASDSRLLLLPLLIISCLLILTSDTDLWAIFLFKQGLLPFLIIWLCSHRSKSAPT